MGKYFVGIDFGTTNSSVAVIDEVAMKAKELQLKNGYGPDRYLLRTLLAFSPSGQISVEETGASDPERRVESFKRRIMEDSAYTFSVDGETYTATQLISIFLGELLHQSGIEAKEVKRLVLSVPTHYNEDLKNIMEKAAADIGIDRNCVWFIDEPVSVLWNYQHQLSSGKLLLVFDFGGGTLDLAVMNRNDNSSGINSMAHLFDGASKNSNFSRGKVLAKKGIEIGGDDLDEVIMRLMLEEGQRQHNAVCEQLDLTLFDDRSRIANFRTHTRTRMLYNRLKRLAETVKIQLSNQDSVTVSVPPLIPKHDLVGIRDISLTAAQFYERAGLIWDAIRSSIKQMESDLQTHGLSLSDIDTILLSGGSCKVPFVLDMLEELLPNAKLSLDANMQTSICKGNANYSYHDDEVMIGDFVNSSYGLYSHLHSTAKEVVDSAAEYPITVKKRLATGRPYQDAIRIVPMVRKGEEGDYSPIRKNGQPISFSMKITPLQEAKNYDRITVDFTIDKSQKLKIAAYDNATKKPIGVEELSLHDID